MLKQAPKKKFLKDLRRIQKRNLDLKKLRKVLLYICKNKKAPKNTKPHKLKGEWSGTHECHIEGDWLLIYSVVKTSLVLYRTGTHSELFR